MVIQNNKNKVKIGRPKEVQGTLRLQPLNLEISRFQEFKELCEENGISASEGIRQLIENELDQNAAVTTIGVEYNKDGEMINRNNIVTIKLDNWMTDNEAMNMIEEIPTEKCPQAFAALQKMIRKLDFRMKGKGSMISIR